LALPTPGGGEIAGAGGEHNAPIIMGILNVTPDSFSDGGEFFEAGAAAARAAEMMDQGADIVDVGGESTRPGADSVSDEEETRRVVPIIREILAASPGAVISIDTYHAATAEAALEAGAGIVNDVTALNGDSRMAGVVAEAGCPVVLMHMLGEPKTMQEGPHYEDVVSEVRESLARRTEAAIEAGISPEAVILDPGIGFGKTLEHNLALIENLDAIVDLGFPVLFGASRKSFIGKLSGGETGERLFGTVATSVLAYERGANIFRVHDVRANREALEVAAAVVNVGDDS
jgi:dihydropteroate synthase